MMRKRVHIEFMRHIGHIGFLLLNLLFSLPTFAQHQLDSVFILVRLQDDGSARVTERRDAHMSDQGTEGFITFNNMGDIEVKDLAVFDEKDIDFEVEEEWDVERSREAKTHKCGYHRTPEGVELCWGIGKSGKRSYYISYTLTHLVKSYDDYDGFCHSFYEAKNSPAAFAMVDVIVNVDTLSKKDARIWTFGYDGWKGHASNFVWARTEDGCPMRNGDAVIILMEMKKGILHPDVTKEGSFKELVKAPAFVSSSYDVEVAMGDTLEDGTMHSSLMGGEVGTGHEGKFLKKIDLSLDDDGGGFNWGLIGGFLLIVGLIAWAAKGPIMADRNFKKMQQQRFDTLTEMMGGKKWDELPYWRELPMQGNLLGSSAVLSAVMQILNVSHNNPIKGIDFSVQHLYEAFILRMFYKGGITLDYDTDKYGKTRQLFRIKEPVKPEKQPNLDETKNVVNDFSLYGARRRAVEDLYKGLLHDDGIQYMLQDLLYKAADSDHLLQPDELKTYVKNNLERLRPMADALYRMADLRKEDWALQADEVQQVVGFVHYLKDFSLVEERHIEEVNLWKEYLVFASFYGIADQVRKDMKKVAPDTTKLDELIPPHQVVEDFKPITTSLASALSTARMYETAYEREKRLESYSSSDDHSYSSHSYSSSSGGSGHSSYSGGGGHSGGGGSGFR